MDVIEQPSSRLAYIAAACEDAQLGEGGKPGYFLDIESRSKRWLQVSIASRISEILHREVKVRKRTTRVYYRIRIWDKDLVLLVTEIKKSLRVILHWSEESKLSWVSGFIDAEGSVTRNKEKQPMLSVYNADIRRLRLIGRILKPFGVKARYYKPLNRDVWQQYFTNRSNLIRLSEIVRIEHPEKNAKLRSYLRKAG